MSRRLPLAVAALCAGSALVRWRIADLADWGIDESANLWLATLIADGRGGLLGLVSSRGVPNLAGTPLLAVPLTALPDLLAVSRALALAHLCALLPLALALARGATALPVAALLFCPALLLASPSLWNQYLALPIGALVAWLLLRLAESPDAWRGVSPVLLAALLLLQPAVHLAGFADLAVQLPLALTLLAVARRRGAPEVGAPAMAALFAGAGPLYAWWLGEVPGLPAGTRLAGGIGAGLVVVVAFDPILDALTRHLPHRRRLATSRALAWAVPLLLAAGAGVTLLTLRGAQIGARLLDGGGWGVALLACQVATAAIALPGLAGAVADCAGGARLGELLARRFAGREAGAAVLLANAALLGVAHAALEPLTFLPSGRPDLLVPLLPALLAPSLLLAACEARRGARRWSAGAAGVAVALSLAFAGSGPVARHWRDAPRFLPASEMRAVADWIAARGASDGTIDVAYDLEDGREWLVRIACSPRTSWYTVSRPFDWLLWRRHGLRDRREGSCARRDGGRFRVAFRHDAPRPGERPGLLLGQLAVWETAATDGP